MNRSFASFRAARNQGDNGSGKSTLLRRIAGHETPDNGEATVSAPVASAPELLLLDEPTNDLDDAALAWLEKHIRGHRGTVVVITHDRRFLENVTTVVLEVDADRRSVRRYGNGYTGYLTAKAAARARWEHEYEDWLAEVVRQTRLAETAGAFLASISRKGPWAFSGNGHHGARSSSTATSNKVRNARERLRRLTEHAVPKPPEPLRFTASVSAVAPGSAAPEAGDEVGTVAELTDVRVGARLYVDSLRIEAGERVLVTGPNGAGKTTLLRVLARETPWDTGRVRVTDHVGHLRQDEPRALHARRPSPRTPVRSSWSPTTAGCASHSRGRTSKCGRAGRASCFRRCDRGRGPAPGRRRCSSAGFQPCSRART